MAGSDDAFFVTGVASGLLDETCEQVLLTFEGVAGPVRMVLPAAELMALVSICIGLAGQSLPAGGGGELATIPVVDWRIGVTTSGGLVLGLAPEAGGALSFRLTLPQAREMVAALGQGVQLAQADDQPARMVRGSH